MSLRRPMLSASISRTLRRLAAPFLAGLAAIPLVGCGGGGVYGPYEPVGGTLEIRNDYSSYEGIDAVEISQPFGPTDTFNLYLAPGDRDFIDLIPDGYDVDLFWSDGSVDSYFDIDIYPDSTTILTGSN